ncbi:MarR family winged helix-turn-helix transcriptional regulator [Umezawaea beigongshangensis]|uniref:MarR family winged helix-turn-helix transcriptional regulator n=1 Tax=Umezawaea beigongshangensis TaxID=2780383 RepID=UPI0018F1C4E3|nr:MarR family winged helix-turn-helix transcriptional regulator [Umezawaea beigongshangensis]
MADVEALTAHEQQLWRELGRLVHALPRVLEDDMTKTAGVTMTDFAVLLVLSEAPRQRMRMAELATATGLTASRMTRVVNGLRARSLVDKERDRSDARGNVAVLTGEGLARMRAAEPQHLTSAHRRVLDHVPAEAIPVLADALRRITATLVGAAERPSGR